MMNWLLLCFAFARIVTSQTCAEWVLQTDQVTCFSNLGINFASYSPDAVTADQAWGFCQCLSSAPSDCGTVLAAINSLCASGEDCVKSIVNAAPTFETCIGKYSGDGHTLAKCACFSEANINCDESLAFLGVETYCKAVYDTVDAVIDTLSSKIANALTTLSSGLTVTVDAVPGNGGKDRQITITDNNSEGLAKIETWITDVCTQINTWIANDCDGHDSCKSLAITCPVVKTAKRTDTYVATLGYQGSSGVAVASLLGLLSLLALALL